MERVGTVAYRLMLPSSLEEVHNVFHVSQLCKYILDEKHVFDYSGLTLWSDLTFDVQPIAIIDRIEKVLKNKVIYLVKVAWDPDSSGESTWELKEEI